MKKFFINICACLVGKLRGAEFLYNHAKLMDLGEVSDKCVIYHNFTTTKLNSEKSALNIGAYTHIRGGIFIYHHGRIKIGDYCYVGDNTQIWACKNIEIGNRVLIAHNVNIIDNISHPIDARDRHEHYKSIISDGFPDIDLDGKEIVIQDDAWINENAVIMRGVKIGKGAIIGAGSIVTHDVPPYSFACGNPAKIIKQL